LDSDSKLSNYRNTLILIDLPRSYKPFICRTQNLDPLEPVVGIRGDEPNIDAVEQLMDHVSTLPLTVSALLADSGFYHGASTERLDAVVSVNIPTILSGKQKAEKLAST